MNESTEPIGVKRAKEGVAIITAAAAVVGGTTAIIGMMVLGIIQSDAGLPIVAGVISGGSVFLWNAKAAKDARDAALAQPGTDT